MTQQTVCVVGLGKIGLALAAQYASRGWLVHGADIDRRVVDAVNEGATPTNGELGLDERLLDASSRGLLDATTDTSAAVAQSDVVVVVVPLVVDKQGQPEFAALDSATASIAAGLRANTTVIYETTLPVSTTRTRFTPALEAGSGLRCGADLFVAFSPERVYVGRIFADLRRYPKLVGGVDHNSTRRAVSFYESALEFDSRPDLALPNGVWEMGSAEAAELAKLADTTYRDINIAFANELARFAERSNIDVVKVIEAANSQPYSHIHHPGIAVGGHCIPVYPQLYLANDASALVPAAARETNMAMPQHCVNRVAAALGGLHGKRIVVFGAAYRGGVKETAFSGVFPLVEAINEGGGTAIVHDPLYTDEEIQALDLAPYHVGEPADAAVIQADHAMYADLGPADVPGLAVILDGRGITDPSRWSEVRHLQLGVAGPNTA